MIEILQSPEHLVAMKLSGSLTGTDFDKAAAAVDNALEKNERVSMYAEMDDSFGYTMEGLLKDLWYDLGMVGKYHRFYRAAIVTDKKWLAALARAEGVMFSMIEIRVFPSVERDAAFEWASAEPEPKPAPRPVPPSVTFIETTEPTVIAYEVDGRLTSKDLDVAIARMNKAFESNEKLRVLARIKNLKGFDISAFFRGDLFSMKRSALRNVERYAIVGPPIWLRNLVELISPIFGTEMRVFDADDENSAWEWVGARPADKSTATG